MGRVLGVGRKNAFDRSANFVPPHPIPLHFEMILSRRLKPSALILISAVDGHISSAQRLLSPMWALFASTTAWMPRVLQSGMVSIAYLRPIQPWLTTASTSRKLTTRSAPKYAGPMHQRSGALAHRICFYLDENLPAVVATQLQRVYSK